MSGRGSGTRKTSKTAKKELAREKAAARWNQPPPLEPIVAPGGSVAEESTSEEPRSPAEWAVQSRLQRKRRYEELSKEGVGARQLPILERIHENDGIRDEDVRLFQGFLEQIGDVEAEELQLDDELQEAVQAESASAEPGPSRAADIEMADYLAVRMQNAAYRKKLVELAVEYAQSNEKLKDARGKLYERTRSLKRFVGKDTIPQAQKPYSAITDRGKLKAHDRLRSILAKAFPLNDVADTRAMIQSSFPDALRGSNPLNAAQTLQFQNEVRISNSMMDRARQFMKRQGLSIFASRRKVNDLRKTFCTEDEIMAFETSYDKGGKAVNVIGAKVRSVRAVLQDRLDAQVRGGLIDDSCSSVQVCLVADKGASTVKLGALLSTARSVNAPSNMSLLAMYEGNEDRELMQKVFEEIADQVFTLTSIVIPETNRTVRVDWFFTGDLKLLKIVCGVRASTARNPCVLCVQPAESTFGNMEPMPAAERAYLAVNQAVCQDREIIFRNLDVWHIVPPGLHLFMGATERLRLELVKKLYALELRRKHEQLGDVLAQGPVNAKEKLRLFNKLSIDLQLNQPLLDAWAQVRTAFEIETADFEAFSEAGASEICVSKHCVERIAGIDLPPRAQYDVEAIPDSIETAPNSDKWIHTICAGQLPFAAATAGKDPNFMLDEEGSIEDVKKAIAEECIALQRIDHDLRDKLKTLESELRKLYPEADSEFAQFLDRCFEKLGAYRSLYFQQYTGGQYREVLKQIDKLRALLQHETYGDLSADGEVHNVLRALELLGRVQGFTIARLLSEDEINQLETAVNQLRDHLVQSHPNVKPGHKFHIILKHLVPFARRWKTINLFSEQAIESAHNVLLTLIL